MNFNESYIAPCADRCRLFAAIGLTLTTIAQEPMYWIHETRVITEKRVGRTEFEYEMQASLFNNVYPHYGCPMSSATAKLGVTGTPAAEGITILDGNLQFGPSRPGEMTWSVDTFTVRIDRAISAGLQFSWDITPSFSAADQPALFIVRPSDETHTETDTVVVEGTVSAGATVTIESTSQIQAPGSTVSVATVEGERFSGIVTLTPGENLITVSAYPGPCGPETSTSLSIFRDPPSEDDISVSAHASAETASVGDVLTYTLQVDNRGPQDSNDVVLTNRLPEDTAYLGGTTSQGVLSELNGVVTAHLGSLAGNHTATITLSVRIQGDSLLNQTEITRTEPEAYTANNSVNLYTPVHSFYSFHVKSLQATGLKLTSHFDLGFSWDQSLGNAPGDLAISPTSLLLSGSASMGQYSLGDLNRVGSSSTPRFGTVSDLRTGNVWQMGRNGVPFGSRSSQVLSDLLPLTDSGRETTGRFLVEYGPDMALQEWTSFLGRPDAGYSSEFRLRALLEPPVTGEYIFWFAGSNAELALSPDEDPKHLQPTGLLGPGDSYYGEFPLPTPRIPLVAGRRYLFEVRGGFPGLASPNISLSWTKPGESPTHSAPIPPGVIHPVSAAASALQGSILHLSHPIPLGRATGIFSGYGRVVIFNGVRIFNLDLSTGQVTDLGPFAMPEHLVQSDGWFWGLAENDGDAISIVYVRDSQTVVRTRVPDGQTSVVSTFTYLGEMAVINAMPRWSKWVFASGTESQFDEGNSTPLGTADARFQISGARLGNDISVSATAADLPATANKETAVVITVSNSGPTPATGVILTDLLDGMLSLQSVEVSQGTHRQSDHAIECDLGEIPGGASATVTIRYLPLEAGRVIHSVSVTRHEPDFYLPNNREQLTVPVDLPALQISGDIAVVEGDGGETGIVFHVTLSKPLGSETTVSYTMYGSAMSGSLNTNPKADYEGHSGQLTFLPGETSKDILVTIYGDTRHERDEDFEVVLFGTTMVRIARGRATCMILNDDPAPMITVTGLSADEGNGGFFHPVGLFKLTLSDPSETWISVHYAIGGGTATAPEDFTEFSSFPYAGFPPGETEERIAVAIVGDSLVEGDETVKITLSDPVNAGLANSEAIGTIRDDDVALAAAGTVSGGVQIEFRSLFGAHYRVEMATSVVGEWKPVDHLKGTGEILKWLPAESPTHSCFYRVVQE